MGGAPIGYLVGGLLWGAFMWFSFAVLIVIFYRELTTRFPLPDAGTLPERLAEVVKPYRYTVQQSSPTSFVCESKRGLGRFISFEYTKIHVEWRDGCVHSSGPAFLVNKVRKKLLADSPTSRES